jgi:hypothetical protein
MLHQHAPGTLQRLLIPLVDNHDYFWITTSPFLQNLTHLGFNFESFGVFGFSNFASPTFWSFLKALVKLEYLYFHLEGDWYGGLMVPVFDVILEQCPTPDASDSFKAVIFHFSVRSSKGLSVGEVVRWSDERWASKGVIVSFEAIWRANFVVHETPLDASMSFAFDWAVDKTEREERIGRTLWEKVDEYLEERRKLVTNDKDG